MSLQKAIEHGKEKRRPWPHYRMLTAHAATTGLFLLLWKSNLWAKESRAAMNAIAKDAGPNTESHRTETACFKTCLDLSRK